MHRFFHEIHVATNKLFLSVDTFVSVQDIQSVCHAPQPPVNYIQTTQTATEADIIRRSLFALLVVRNGNTYAVCMVLGVDAATPFSMIALTIRTPLHNFNKKTSHSRAQLHQNPSTSRIYKAERGDHCRIHGALMLDRLCLFRDCRGSFLERGLFLKIEIGA